MDRVRTGTVRPFVLALAAGVALAACSGGGGGSTPPTVPGATPTATPAETPTPSPIPTPTPVPQFSSTSTYYVASATPYPAISFTGGGQTAVIDVSESGYSGAFTVSPDGAQTNGTGCSGTIATVTPSNGTSFTFTASSNANACGSQLFTFADSHLTNVELNVVLTQTGIVAQKKHRKAKH